MTHWQTLSPATTWAEWGQVFTAIDIWAPAVREICHRAGLPVETIEAGYPGSNAVFIVDRRYVVKIYAPLCPKDYAIECELYPLLSRYPDLLTAELIAQGTLDGATTWPYIIISFLPGQPIREVREQMSQQDRIAVATDLGRRVRVLHSIPVHHQKVLETSRESWHAYVQQALAHTTRQLSGSEALLPALVQEIPSFVHQVLEGQGEPDLVLVSGDLTDDHVLLTPSADRWSISGMIDFADTLAAPPDYEWIALWFSALDRDTASLAAFARGYGPPILLTPTFYDRALAYTFLHEYGATMISDTLQRLSAPQVQTMATLRLLLWRS